MDSRIVFGAKETNMKKFHLLSAEERQTFLQEVSFKTGMQPAIIEKDYWVVWILWLLFNQEKLKSSLTFKGGTSLSKVYGLIQRFSEDVDLSIEKSFLGMPEEQLPENASSRKKRAKSLKDLSMACKDYVQNVLLNALKKQIAYLLEGASDWTLRIDENDPDGQTLLFSYPTLSSNKNEYIEKSVKIEMGARSEHWPVSQKKISSYLKENLNSIIEEPEFKVTVLNAERTFWEKATILHQYAHIPETKPIKLRHSRHYYDFYQLLNSPVKALALTNSDLLEKVARHKEIYFHSSWANYSSAIKGSLKLIPPERIADDLKNDYRLMKVMFFEEPVEWEVIMKTIKTFEREFNEL